MRPLKASINSVQNVLVFFIFILMSGCCSEPEINFNNIGSLKDAKQTHIALNSQLNSMECIENEERLVLLERVDSAYLERVVQLLENARLEIENTPRSFSNKLSDIENLLVEFESQVLKIDGEFETKKTLELQLQRINEDIVEYTFEKNWESRENTLLLEINRLLDEKAVSITGKKELLSEDVIEFLDKNISSYNTQQRIMKYTVHLERRYKGLFSNKVFQGTALWEVQLKKGNAQVVVECECVSCYKDLALN